MTINTCLVKKSSRLTNPITAKQLKRLKNQAEAEQRATNFKLLCKASGLPLPVAEFRFDESRRWRFDWAFEPEKIAIEVDGGLYVAGAHVRGARVQKTHEKLNAAAKAGWRILYCVPKDLCSDATIELIRSSLTTERSA